MTNKKTVSIGIICFNEELNVPLAYQELAKLADSEKKYNFEFIFVDNGSTDATKKEIKKVAKDKRVSGIFLSKLWSRIFFAGITGLCNRRCVCFI